MSEGAFSIVVDGVEYNAVVPDITAVTIKQANNALQAASLLPSGFRFVSQEEATQQNFMLSLAGWIDYLRRIERKMLARKRRLDRRYLRRRAGVLADPKWRRRIWARQ